MADQKRDQRPDDDCEDGASRARLAWKHHKFSPNVASPGAWFGRRGAGAFAALTLALGAAPTLAPAYANRDGADARDMIVVRSTDPAHERGARMSPGDELRIAPGRQVTLLGHDGSLRRLMGSEGPIRLEGPERRARVDPDRMSAALMTLLAPRDDDGRRVVGGSRAGPNGSEPCPDPKTLGELEAILKAHESGCGDAARQAFDAYVDGPDAPGGPEAGLIDVSTDTAAEVDPD